jgi:hypothetical protein
LGRDNFGYVSGLFIMPDSPLTVLLPYSELDFMPRDEYLEVLGYALEDYLEGGTVEDLFSHKTIDAIVEVDGAITSALGGTVEAGGRSARFETPVLDLLTLEKSKTFSLSWR